MNFKLRTVLLLGTFTDPSESIESYFSLTKNAKLFDLNSKGALMKQLISDGPFSPDNKIKLLTFDDPTVYEHMKDYEQIAIVNLGPVKVPAGLMNGDIRFENIIKAVVFAIKYFNARHFDVLAIDASEHPKLFGTSVVLALHALKGSTIYQDAKIAIQSFDDFHLEDEVEYETGIQLGNGQIVAQKLMKSCSLNEFIQTTKLILGEFNLNVVVREDSWICQKKMNCLLSVSKNSEERPVLMEVEYNVKKSPKPLMLVGKATPFESSLFPLDYKPELHMFQYRSGMGGASSIIGCLYTLCKLKVPVRVHCIIALVWNQQYVKPNKKGDVVLAMNETSIQIDRPEAEGRLIMADLLCYADTFNSAAIIDVTTLSSNIESLVGNSYIAFFTSDSTLKKLLHEASISSGEKVWQLPLFKCFRDLLKVPLTASISNVGSDAKIATAVKSSVFLREFVKEDTPWIHLDISAVSECKGRRPYILDWATGHSTRLLSEFCMGFVSGLLAK